MKIYTFLYFVCISISVLGQNWCPPGAQWAYAYYGVANGGSSNLCYEKDTIIDGQPCQQIVGRLSYGNNSIGKQATIYTFERNDTVFFYNGYQFWPMYFFNAALGDTLTIRHPNDYLECDSFLTLIVDSVGSLQANGQSLRYYRAVYTATIGPYPQSMQVVEKFGAIDNYLVPVIECSGWIDVLYYDLGCYEDSSFTRHQVNPNINCRYYYTGIEEGKEFLDKIELSPNPAGNSLYISLPNESFWQYKIMDYYGRTVDSGEVAKENTVVDVGLFTSGIYLVMVQLDNGQYSVKRFVKE